MSETIGNGIDRALEYYFSGRWIGYFLSAAFGFWLHG